MTSIIKSLASNITICHLNIRSLTKHFDELLYEKEILNHDIICFSETWLNDSHLNSNINLPGFKFVRKDRITKSRGGGLIIYIRSTFDFVTIDLKTQGVTEILGARIRLGATDIDLILVYAPLRMVLS